MLKAVGRESGVIKTKRKEEEKGRMKENRGESEH